MNILEQEDIIKGLPDAALMKEASAPSGQVPQFLVVSEIKRRSDMRKRYQEQEQQEQGTVKDQIVMEAMGIAPMMPSAMTPPQPPAAPMGAPPMGGMTPQGMPPMAPPQAPKPPMPMGGIASAPQAMPPMGMAEGGIVRMQQGRQTPNDTSLRLRRILASNPGITFADLMSMGFTQADLDRLSNLGYQERIDSERILGDAISGLERVDPEMRLSKTIPTQVKPASDIYSQSAVTGFVEDMSRAAQENMPNYSMIAPAGMGDINFGMPTRDQAQAADRAKVESLRAGLSPSITSGDIDSAIAGMVTERAPRSTAPELSTAPQRGAGGRPFDLGGISDVYEGSSLKAGIEALGGSISDELSATPLAQFDREASQRIREVMEKDGIGAAIGQFGREAVASVMPAARTVVEGGIAPILGAVGEGVAYVAGTPIISEPARALDQLVTGSVDDPLTLNQIFGGKDDATVQGASPVQVQANGMLPEYTDYRGVFPAVAADEVAAQSPFSLEYLQRENARAAGRKAAQDTDLSTFAGKTVNEKGESTPETKLVDAVTELPRNDRSAPELDFSDLIAEGKQQALNNAIIQLGAGVASGDVAKGLSAAGTAAMKGTADARALDMRSRLAEYQAGREDIRRGEEADRFERQMTSKESQFDKQLAQLERKIDASIDVSNATTQREILRAMSGEVESLREKILIMSPTEKARFRTLESELYRMLGIDMPDAEVTAGLSGKDLSGLESLIGG